jgi:hypothetical protein
MVFLKSEVRGTIKDRKRTFERNFRLIIIQMELQATEVKGRNILVAKKKIISLKEFWVCYAYSLLTFRCLIKFHGSKNYKFIIHNSVIYLQNFSICMKESQ